MCVEALEECPVTEILIKEKSEIEALSQFSWTALDDKYWLGFSKKSNYRPLTFFETRMGEGVCASPKDTRGWPIEYNSFGNSFEISRLFYPGEKVYNLDYKRDKSLQSNLHSAKKGCPLDPLSKNYFDARYRVAGNLSDEYVLQTESGVLPKI